jgi:hypothetical protein
VAGRTRSIKKSSDLIGNQTCDLPACSIVPQTTMLPHISGHKAIIVSVVILYMTHCVYSLNITLAQYPLQE